MNGRENFVADAPQPQVSSRTMSIIAGILAILLMGVTAGIVAQAAITSRQKRRLRRKYRRCRARPPSSSPSQLRQNKDHHTARTKHTALVLNDAQMQLRSSSSFKKHLSEVLNGMFQGAWSAAQQATFNLFPDDSRCDNSSIGNLNFLWHSCRHVDLDTCKHKGKVKQLLYACDKIPKIAVLEGGINTFHGLDTIAFDKITTDNFSFECSNGKIKAVHVDLPFQIHKDSLYVFYRMRAHMGVMGWAGPHNSKLHIPGAYRGSLKFKIPATKSTIFFKYAEVDHMEIDLKGINLHKLIRDHISNHTLEKILDGLAEPVEKLFDSVFGEINDVINRVVTPPIRHVLKSELRKLGEFQGIDLGIACWV